jgi:stage II sporulation protein AB (anti-sigma F factor)
MLWRNLGIPYFNMSVAGDEAQTFSRSFRAVPESVPMARRAVVDFAERAGASQDLIDSIRLVVSEAVTNAVVHAYHEDGGEVHVAAALASDELWLLIGDDGHGLEVGSRRPGLGMGLALIASTCDQFSVVKRSSTGTELRMRFRLAPARRRDHERGSLASAKSPARSRFSTTT